MKAMILAAGRGERMRPLTDQQPKPLLKVADRSLIERLIEALVQAGVRAIVVNHAHHGQQIVAALGDGRRYGARIVYSHESTGGLETGGGILQAMHLLDDPFLVVNGDILTDYPFTGLPSRLTGLAHLVMVDNPPHHPHGDFALIDQHLQVHGPELLTFSGIGIYSKELFKNCVPGKFPLAPLLRTAMARHLVTGEHYTGDWWDIGTPERLLQLDQYYRDRGL